MHYRIKYRPSKLLPYQAQAKRWWGWKNIAPSRMLLLQAENDILWVRGGWDVLSR